MESKMTSAELAAKVEEIGQDGERREARERWLAAGGYQRRPLKSFMTDADKRERREEHAAMVRAVREWLATEEGIREWLISRELNPDMSALNQALVAYQAPRTIAATNAGWKRSGAKVRKGEHGALWITAPGFWPKPAFLAVQTDAPEELTDPEIREPLPEVVEDLAGMYADDDLKAGFAAIVGKVDGMDEIPTREVAAVESTPEGQDDCPF